MTVHPAFAPAIDAIRNNEAGLASLARIEERLAEKADEVIVGRIATSGMIAHYRQRTEAAEARAFDAEQDAAIAQREFERIRAHNASLREEIAELMAENEALARNKRVPA